MLDKILHVLIYVLSLGLITFCIYVSMGYYQDPLEDLIKGYIFSILALILSFKFLVYVLITEQQKTKP